MVNFVYAIGDRETGEALLVDPAYGVDDLLDVLAADGMRVRRGARPPTSTPTTSAGRPRRVAHRGGGRAARAGRRCRSTSSATRCPGSSGPPGSGGRPGRPRQRRRGEGGRGRRSSWCTPPATPRAASASWWTAAWWRATPSSSRAAAGPTCPAATPRPCTSRSPPAWPGCPTTRSSSPATSTRAEPSATMGETRRHNYVFRPRIARGVAGHVRPVSSPAALRGRPPADPLGDDGTVVVVGASLAGLAGRRGDPAQPRASGAGWSWSARSSTSPTTARRCPSRCWPGTWPPSGPCSPTTRQLDELRARARARPPGRRRSTPRPGAVVARRRLGCSTADGVVVATGAPPAPAGRAPRAMAASTCCGPSTTRRPAPAG